MPNLQRLVVGPGTKFTAARHNIAMCSPARAGFLTGQLSKRHNVRSQRDAFQQHNDPQRTLPVWLQSAGYTTGLVGKYFTSVEGRSTPPGWNVRRQLADKSQDQHGYEVWDGSEIRAPDLDQTALPRAAGALVPRTGAGAVLPVVHAHGEPQPVRAAARSRARLRGPAVARSARGGCRRQAAVDPAAGAVPRTRPRVHAPEPAAAPARAARSRRHHRRDGRRAGVEWEARRHRDRVHQ